MPQIALEASDGHRFAGWRADPAAQPKGGVVIIQEIFGVNRHIRRVVETYAQNGYAAVAPALFDRTEAGVELGYDEAALGRAVPLMQKVDTDKAMLDIEAAIKAVAPAGKVATVGYCMGGRLSWVSAAKLPLSGAVCYYGGGIGGLLDLEPHCPVMMHFGEKDSHIPMSDVDKVRQTHPEVELFTYPAGHGFNCEDRADFDQPSTELAFARTLEFLGKIQPR